MKKNSHSDINIVETFYLPNASGELEQVLVPDSVRIEYFTPSKLGKWVCEKRGNSCSSCTLSQDGYSLICHVGLSSKYLGEGPLLKVVTEMNPDPAFPNSVKLNGLLASTGIDLWPGQSENNAVNSETVISVMKYGYSSYELAVKLGLFEGTEQEYIQAYLDAITTANSDHTRAEEDHRTAGTDHTRAVEDHQIASEDHGTASTDHTRADEDHTGATDDHRTAGLDHNTASEDHRLASGDHETAGTDHTRAGEDHNTAALDHNLSQELNSHPMRINTDTYTWERWDTENDCYVDTGIPCWTPLYAQFDVNITTGQLEMNTEVSYAGGTFAVNESTGQLTLTI